MFSQKKVDGTTFGDFTTFPNPADHFRSVKGTGRNDFGKKIYSKLIILCNIKGRLSLICVGISRTGSDKSVIDSVFKAF